MIINKLPRIEDPRGNLSFIEHGAICPFPFGDISWLYDVPAGAVKHGSELGGEKMLIAMSGSFDIESDNQYVNLRRSDCGAIMSDKEVFTLKNFSTNSVVLTISSENSDFTKSQPKNNPAKSHLESNVDCAHIFDIPRQRLDCGSLIVARRGAEWLPFDIKRVFYLFDVPADAERGGHSHYEAQELIIALSGCFDVVLYDGKKEPRRFTLNRPYQGLYVPTGLWRTLDNFSGGSVCMVLTSEPYSEADYVRNLEKFKQLSALLPAECSRDNACRH